MIMFLKNVSIAGGFLLLVANGAGPLSIDSRSKRSGSLAEHRNQASSECCD